LRQESQLPARFVKHGRGSTVLLDARTSDGGALSAFAGDDARVADMRAVVSGFSGWCAPVAADRLSRGGSRRERGDAER
jgi:hypothetical protein